MHPLARNYDFERQRARLTVRELVKSFYSRWSDSKIYNSHLHYRFRPRPHNSDIFLESATFSFRIQKFLRPHVAKISGLTAKFAGCVWTEAVSGKKKLLIQKYPDSVDGALRPRPHVSGYFRRRRFFSYVFAKSPPPHDRIKIVFARPHVYTKPILIH